MDRWMSEWMDRWDAMEWTDGGVLIRYLIKWMTFRRPLGLDFWGGARWGELGVRCGVAKKLRTRMLTLIFVFKCDCYIAILELLLTDSGRILHGFGEYFDLILKAF